MITQRKVHSIETLEDFTNEMWIKGIQSDTIQQLQKSKAFSDKRLLAIYLSQVYHYAVHTPKHQALVGVNPNNKSFQYMQYCFMHAYEETSHELMALKDLNSLGYNVSDNTMPPRLKSTDLLISFLYKEAHSMNPIHHLGYGFWSENAAPFIGEFMRNLATEMGVRKNQLTFYNNHATIDVDHAKAVRLIISQVAKTNEDWKGIVRVAKITFDLTLGIIKDSIEAYEQLITTNNSDFAVFK